MAVVDELLAIGEEDRRKKQFLQDNPLFGMEPYHEVRPTYNRKYLESIESLPYSNIFRYAAHPSLLEPLTTKPDAGPLDINFWTGLLSTPLVKSMRPREEPTKMEYAFSGVPFTPGLGVAPSLGRAAAKRFIPEFDPSRRTFLKTSATVGALTGLGIPLAKKALTKTTGVIEGLAQKVSNDIIKLDYDPNVGAFIADVSKKLKTEWFDSLRRINIKLDKVQGTGSSAETESAAKIGDSLYDDSDSLNKMAEHLGVDSYSDSVFNPYEGGHATKGVLGKAYKTHRDWADSLKPEDVSDDYAEMYQGHLAHDDALEQGLEQMVFDEVDALNYYAEDIVGKTASIKDILNRLSYLERTDPELLIRLIDEEIAETSGLMKKISDPVAGFGSSSSKITVYKERKVSLAKLQDIRKQIADRLNIPKPKKKDDVSIVQRVLDPLGYTRMKAPYEK